jgi:guanylate kinase
MSESKKRRGTLIVLSAPSGGGKSTIAKALFAAFPNLRFSISATTRAVRPGEVNGREYYFLKIEEFERRIKAGELVEYEQIYGDYYGTLKSEIEKAFQNNEPILFDVDVKGALSIKGAYPNEAILIFLQPPSFEVLKSRLVNRNTENAEALKRRLERVKMELELGRRFDYQVINDDLNHAIAEVKSVVEKYLL